MLSAPQILAFLATAVVLTATPGPDNLMVLSMGMSRGRRAGIAFGLGCALGWFSGSVGAWLNRRPSAGLWLDRLAGTVFVGLGLRMMVAR